MFRRAILATCLATFAATGTAFVRAGLPAKPPKSPPKSERQYYNPLGVALSADGRRAYIALNGANAIAEVDLASGRTLRRIPTGNHPREVSHHGSGLTVTDDEPGLLSISLLTGRSFRLDGAPPDPKTMRRNPSLKISVAKRLGESVPLFLQFEHEPHWDFKHGRGGVTDAVFENRLVASHAPPSQPGFQGALGFAGQPIGGLGYFGLQGGTFLARLDTAVSGAAQPADAVWHPSLKRAYVAAASSDSVLVLKPDRLNATGGPSGQQLGVLGATGWAGSLQSMEVPGLVVQRLATQNFPQRMALSDDGRTLVVSNGLSDSLTVIAVGPGGARVVKHIPLGGPEPDAARRGEVRFNSARLSFNGCFACSSCHPGGGSDERVWDTPGEDAGPRRTKSLFGVRDTAPYGWHGDSETLADRVRTTLAKLHKHDPAAAEVRDLVTYLESLDPPVPATPMADEQAVVESGRTLFEGRAKCSPCHAGERLCDGKLHDVGTGGRFDTPSLRGVRGRTCLLHDGKVREPMDIFRHFNNERRHGAAHTLDECELFELQAYLKTL